MGLWAAGMTATMLSTLVIRQSDGVDGFSALLFVLYGVPLIYVLSNSGREPISVRFVDGALAAALGVLCFVHTFAFATLTGTTSQGEVALRTMFDIENAFIALFAAIRFVTETEPYRRSLFGALTAFAISYLLAAGYINHFQNDTDFGTLADLVIDLPFVLLTVLAMDRNDVGPPVPASRVAHVVKAGSPLMLAATLLAVSSLLLTNRPGFAVAGFILASMGTGLRNVMVQARTTVERDKLGEMAWVDALTGLPNRRHFDEVLKREWNRARRSGEGLALLMIDIDHFKALNDAFGHPVGDQSLRQVGRSIADCTTRSSDLTARYGGEEFAVILPTIESADAVALANSICAAVARLGLASPAPGGIVTVSIGVGYADAISSDAHEILLREADDALYAAKEGGRDRVVYQPTAAIG
jgi:diguanylate cyclase (GGDEF)-like protein